MFVWKANDVVIDALEASGHLLHLEKVQHSYPHCWRHKTPIIFRSTPQWFIGMENIGAGEAAEVEQLVQEKRAHSATPENAMVWRCAIWPTGPSSKPNSSRPGDARAWKR